MIATNYLLQRPCAKCIHFVSLRYYSQISISGYSYIIHFKSVFYLLYLSHIILSLLIFNLNKLVLWVKSGISQIKCHSKLPYAFEDENYKNLWHTLSWESWQIIGQGSVNPSLKFCKEESRRKHRILHESVSAFT